MTVTVAIVSFLSFISLLLVQELKSFLLVYNLDRESRLKQPDILFGRTGQELPCLRLCPLEVDVIATHTGPDGGLTTVNRGQRGHVTSQDPDVSFIDSEEDPPSSTTAASSEPTSSTGESRSFHYFKSINNRLEGLLETLPTC